MIKPEIPENEKERLAKLYEYSLLDTIAEDEYDQITRMASRICGAPISLISLIDKDRQWFKSKVGLKDHESPRDQAFCAHAILDEKAMVVQDSRKDERFHDNPYVTEDPNVIFYAGIPLVSDDYALGTLCVIDNEPRDLSEDQLEALEILANQVVKLFELRRHRNQLQISVNELESRNKSLEEFARVAAHDIKSPLANIYSLVDLLRNKLVADDPEAEDILGMIMDSAKSLSSLIDGILQHSRSNALILKDRSWINLEDLVEDTFKLLEGNRKVKLHTEFQTKEIFSFKTALQQVMLNLMANSLKYNLNESPVLVIKTWTESKSLKISIQDNGPGIAPEDQERIFQLFETTRNKDQKGQTGTGIGLATVKSLVEGMGGEISLESALGKGSTFTLSL